MIANVLSIAGTDPSGGAGIQADLKTFSALGAYGMSVITAVVAQNTRGVRSFQALDADFVGEQIDAVLDDVRVDAIKIGMVANAEIAQAIVQRIDSYELRNIVVDPVMAAKSGDPLLATNAIAAVRDELVPRATVITPNLPEAGLLLDRSPARSLEAMDDCAAELHRLGPAWVLLTGGHLDSAESVDILYDGDMPQHVSAPRIDTKNDHGTGCTLSSAIAALLPHNSVPDAVAAAKRYLSNALAASQQLQVGGGHGPVHHFYAQW
ncbi:MULTISPECIES: bifunctional hydroxymethylpyrimidine kinase/phosphomethylpyrimidine kinase [Pseudomonadota]|uniref:bifunctional hydroxymethylpyrimidine kinase/phosphomethylpyrimidine kinase n=1 Tax=Pseudomonadota TaxID=1224 RepID=UPI000C86BF4A|nr:MULTISPECIES: bifunctional hydroxymethylpyrimidine kinase/phosphomethylpyrimidine kinase [Pseudomonadota]MBR8049484.1 bifunctional hydroxymethylpyrimidine kinase/phosphomethylpyrimidine kinase [Burkholderia multivorans]PMU17565.1 bifunctional hydroxymethylpyrimidine kinase/phosphomethylpyrimidine kinase [Pseudomonas sp. GP01-A9]PMU27069.1 bifunctional hydroxymethylpyrimidine kinase/phosphomethylpyrimidine kinase [Pseudomonas sp. GP01-A13]PMU36010.1 bifunctional hydroxymethylpyrimidine kinase